MRGPSLPARAFRISGRRIMARRPDTPCAKCGELLWGGSTSRPAGERICRSCRSDPAWQAHLRQKSLTRRRERRPSRAAARSCRGCGVPGALRCDPCRLARQRASWQRKNAKRRGAAPIGPALSVAQLGERDGWRCHLCRRKVDPALPYQHRLAGTRDHLVPVSDGGDDSPANLRLAHRSCNSSRQAGGSVQLMLVG